MCLRHSWGHIKAVFAALLGAHKRFVWGISTPELIRKHLSTELKKDKKMYEIIEGRNIDEDIRNTQAGKSAGVAGWLKMPLPQRPSKYPARASSTVNSLARIKSVRATLFWPVLVTFELK
ncbi:hypothetical protein BY996DRAFT_8683515 [Phakopsora pachyrhizi]|nr:hypothetical protein BY996DRAFT_8683515 [Phakopsora pachyrhizi]